MLTHPPQEWRNRSRRIAFRFSSRSRNMDRCRKPSERSLEERRSSLRYGVRRTTSPPPATSERLPLARARAPDESRAEAMQTQCGEAA
jgi:hypothetical protein